MRWFLHFLNLITVLADTKQLSGIVLSREPAGERFLRIRIFDQVVGLKTALFSLPGKKSKKLVPPDLFDDVDCLLKPTTMQSSIPFVADFQKVCSYRGLAINPLVFLTASQIARFYLINGDHLLEPAPRLNLLRSSLDSFQRAQVPQVVLLKVYFCFARDEGLPVRESWLAGLPQVLTHHTERILGLPVDRATIEVSIINEILDSLRNWMNAETELCVE
ncbi:MAG: hypothetical protein VW576_07150 [Opitutae bacterium]